MIRSALIIVVVLSISLFNDRVLGHTKLNVVDHIILVWFLQKGIQEYLRRMKNGKI